MSLPLDTKNQFLQTRFYRVELFHERICGPAFSETFNAEPDANLILKCISATLKQSDEEETLQGHDFKIEVTRFMQITNQKTALNRSAS